VSTSNRRERELDRNRRDGSSRSSANQNSSNGIVIAFSVVVLGLIGWILFGSNSSTNPNALPSESASPTPSVSLELLDYCGDSAVPNLNPEQFAAPEQLGLQANQIWTLTTNCGDVEIEMFTKLAPETVNSFAFLTQVGYMDGIACHRLTTQGLFVLQCGDPTATGAGGPGYTLPEENLPANETNNYPAGTVAMARTMEPNSGGSQFFIVFEDTTLGPDYTIFGQVISGLDIIRDIAGIGVLGGGADGTPGQPIGILSAKMEKKS
jgi:peptidyl-prolyl cis-trans isomerase B (cyclophilin B)